jgi:hypothetical protein
VKKLTMGLFLISLALLVAACAPNRLKKSLATPAAESQSELKAAIAAPVPDGRNLQPQLGNANIDLDEVVTLLPPDAIPAVLPEDVPGIMVTAAEAEAVGIDPTVRVLGVSINGESRAYPIPFMSAHEIVNDEVGGRLIAATW